MATKVLIAFTKGFIAFTEGFITFTNSNRFGQGLIAFTKVE